MPYKSKRKRKEYNKAWKRKNKRKQKEYNDKWRQKLKDWYFAYKHSSPCVICGESRPAVLEAHHVHRENKSFSMHDGVKTGISIRRLEIEASKCIIVCCLCHRLHHTHSFIPEEQEIWDMRIEEYEESIVSHHRYGKT